MPRRNGTGKEAHLTAAKAAQVRGSTEVDSEEEAGKESVATARKGEGSGEGGDDNSDGDDDEADEEEQEESTDGQEKARKGQRKSGKISKMEMRRWRRLAVEEKEALTNEGGMVWKAAQPLMRSLPSKSKRSMADLLKSTLRSVEEKLDEVLVPQTSRMPQMCRNTGLKAGVSPTGYVTGSVMSWQMEQGDYLLEEDEGREERSQAALLELGGFHSDIAALEALLLPEATETVSMNRAVEEQERELDSLRVQLTKLKADRESRKRKGSGVDSELQSRLKRARQVLDQTRGPQLRRTDGLAMQEAAATRSLHRS